MKIINSIKTILIGSAILDIMYEENHINMRIIPSINPYYYKLKKEQNKK